MSELLDLHLMHLQAIKRRQATIDARRYTLLAADDALQPYGIDDADTDDWLGYLADHEYWKPATAATNRNHFDGFYQWATRGRNPWLRYNPLGEIPRPRQPRGVPNPVTDDELDHAIAESDEWWQLIIMLCALEGFRAGDVAAVLRDDIDEDRVRINDGKGGVAREIPTDADVWERVKDMPAGNLVRGQRLRRAIDPHRLTVMARKHFDGLDLPGVHLQRFRHWFATDLIRRGWDISVVRVLMGHSSILITQRYVDIADETRRLAIRTRPALNERRHGRSSAADLSTNAPHQRGHACHCRPFETASL